MTVFLVVAGTAFSLFGQHAALTTKQETLSGVNIGLRNAIAQLQMDLAEGGQDVLRTAPGASQPFSLGVVIQNNVPGNSPACAPAADWSYPINSACYDSFTIVAPQTNIPLLQISDVSDDLSGSTTIAAVDPNAPAGNVPATLAADAALLKQGDEILVLQFQNSPTLPPPACSGNGSGYVSLYCMTATTLTQDAAFNAGNNTITLTHSLIGGAGQPIGCPGAGCTDPLGLIYSPAHPGGTSYTSAIGKAFSQNAWIIDLGKGVNDITYAVQANPTNPADPQLVRCPGSSCTALNAQPLVDQIVGFKVGAALWNSHNNTNTDIASYFYNSANFCNGAVNTVTDCNQTPAPVNDPYDFSLIRSVRVSLIARTAPNSDLSLKGFANGFDGGPYMVQDASVVVDLRNMN